MISFFQKHLLIGTQHPLLPLLLLLLLEMLQQQQQQHLTVKRKPQLIVIYLSKTKRNGMKGPFLHKVNAASTTTCAAAAAAAAGDATTTTTFDS